jgi:hypothetical protein
VQIHGVLSDRACRNCAEQLRRGCCLVARTKLPAESTAWQTPRQDHPVQVVRSLRWRARHSVLDSGHPRHRLQSLRPTRLFLRRRRSETRKRKCKVRARQSADPVVGDSVTDSLAPPNLGTHGNQQPARHPYDLQGRWPRVVQRWQGTENWWLASGCKRRPTEQSFKSNTPAHVKSSLPRRCHRERTCKIGQYGTKYT